MAKVINKKARVVTIIRTDNRQHLIEGQDFDIQSLDKSHSVFWDRESWIREIPMAVIHNLKSLMEDKQSLPHPQAGPDTKEARITWDQTKEIHQEVRAAIQFVDHLK